MFAIVLILLAGQGLWAAAQVSAQVVGQGGVGQGGVGQGGVGQGGVGQGGGGQAPVRAAVAPALTPQQVQQALEVLRDPQRRAQFIAVLEALARAPQGPGGRVEVRAAPAGVPAEAKGDGAAEADTAAAPAVGPAPAAAPATAAPGLARLAPDSIGAQVIVGVSDRLAQLAEHVVDATRAVAGLPLIGLWLMQLVGDRELQGLLLDTLWRLALVLGLGLGAEWLVRRLFRPLRRRLAARSPRAPEPPPPEREVVAATRTERQVRRSERASRRARRLRGWLMRIPIGLAALLLDLVPALAVLATGYALVGGGLAEQATPRLVVLASVNAYFIYRVVRGLVGMLVVPAERRLRLVPVSDATAWYVDRWARRAAAVGIFGYVAVEAGLLFGLYRLAHGLLMNLIVLVLAWFVVVIVLQNREAVAARIRPSGEAEGVGARLRELAAPAWHVVAVIYVLALWVVLALDVPDGFVRLLVLSAQTGGVLLVSHLVVALALGVLLGGAPLGGAAGANGAAPGRGGAAGSRPGGNGRAGGYLPVLAAVVRLAVGLATVVVLLEVWGVPAYGWLTTAPIGNRLLTSLASIGLTVLLAVAVWEAVNAAIDRHLVKLAASAQPARSARLRTLLPMFRTSLLVTICLVAALIVLSEVGLNIAPLLAGAGVLGVAIGFGSQRLVQDVITGLFLLLENTMQVGDVVTLGGMSGTVENLSVRTIRLRALDGSLHVVPFSAVTTVTNMTRDFGYAVVDVSVGLNENTDHVGDVLREVAAEMRRQPQWAEGVSSDLEVLGVERFIDNAAVLRTRVRTMPAQRWAVVRELNRRIKQRFDELAIESPMTSQRALAPPALDEADG